METKQIKIKVPNGYEIDKDKSTWENIILKPIEVKLPLSVDEISNLDFAKYEKQIKAFRKLIHLRDAWNGDWKPDWMDGLNKFCILKIKNSIKMEVNVGYSAVLHFKNSELAKKFLTQFEDLINEAKELL